MEIKTHNPTEWLQHFGLNHGVEVRNAERTLYLSGQTATNAEGQIMHAGMLVEQYALAWKNLLDALKAADMDAGNLVRLNFYTTDVAQFMEKAEAIVSHHMEAGANISCTLLEVAALYDPDAMIEIEATAVA